MFVEGKRIGRLAATVGVGLILPLLAPNGLSDGTNPPQAQASSLVGTEDSEPRPPLQFSSEVLAQIPSIVVTGTIEGVARSALQDWLVFKPSEEFLESIAPFSNRPADDPWTRLLIGSLTDEQFAPAFSSFITAQVDQSFSLTLPAVFDPEQRDNIPQNIPPQASQEDLLHIYGGTNIDRLGAPGGYYTHIFAASFQDLRIQPRI